MAKRSPRRRKERSSPGDRRRSASLAERAFKDKIWSAYRWSDDEIERALVSGKDADVLEAYLGKEAYADLRSLSQRSSRAAVRGDRPRVLILPGIMGSRIGTEDDLIWFDPLDIVRGNLELLALDGAASKYGAVGVILLSYLRLKLSLRLAGFDAEFHPYDWRRDVRDLGAELAEHLKGEAAEVSLVAHSMGGLVARAALKAGGGNVRRLIMLGTPNYGSFAVPQAVRGVYSVVRTVAALDFWHSAEELAEEVFGTFPGLYDLLPWPEKFSAVDLYDRNEWPSEGPRPRSDLLKGAREMHSTLAAPDDRYVLIAGINQETVTDLSIGGGEFKYRTSPQGDGTVPLAFAQLPGVPTYFVEEEHGSLPSNGAVIAAVEDLLVGTSTGRLPTEPPSERGGFRRSIAERELKVRAFGGRRGDKLRPEDVRGVLTGLASPPSAGDAAPAAAAPGVGIAQRFDNIVVGRRRQRRLDLVLARGSITEVDARAIVLSVYRDVAPSGPATALDLRLEGAIEEFTTRRMFAGTVGETFLMPVGHTSLRAEMLLFAGLGTFDTFSPEVQQLVGENVMRVFIRSRIEEFATVLWGSGSGHGVADTLANMLAGFLRGLAEVDGAHRFRRITLCELDPGRFQEMKKAIYELAGSDLFNDVEVTIAEEDLPAPVEPSAAERGRAAIAGPQPVYLIVRQAPASDRNNLSLQAAILSAGGKAAVFSEAASLSQDSLEKELAVIETNSFKHGALPAYGGRLAELVLPPGVRTALATLKDHPLVLVHDASSSRIPWETIHIGAWSPALGAGMTRRYLAGNLSIAKWLESRRQDPTLDILLVVNPTEDLDGAEAEGRRVKTLLSTEKTVRIKELRGPQATRAVLLKEFSSGRHDVIHYAGHAFFDARVPSQSGLVCHGDEYLTGADLASLGNLPSLVFFNACESGRVRKAPAKKLREGEGGAADRLRKTASFAEAFMRGGVANYVGTYWPVGDSAAETFAGTFYRALLKGATIAEALLESRRALDGAKERDWADYIHYGSPEFVVKPRARG